jgi:ATP-dependent DNA helicase RecQ
LLAVDVEGHGSVQLTEAARPVLKGEERLFLRELQRSEGRQSATSSRSRKPPIDIAERDQPLWEALRGLRRKLSELAGVPAYVVFNDSTLADMIALKPSDKSQMASVSGVGQHKLEQYGDDFLDVIRQHSGD